MSPFIVTTERPNPAPIHGCPATREACEELGECLICDRSPERHRSELPFVLSRKAVATIEEARAVCRDEVVRLIGTKGWFGKSTHEQYERLPESGGSVPLPDGRTITVEAVTLDTLQADLMRGTHRPRMEQSLPGFIDRILAAWNERNGITEGGHDG